MKIAEALFSFINAVEAYFQAMNAGQGNTLQFYAMNATKAEKVRIQAAAVLSYGSRNSKP